MTSVERLGTLIVVGASAVTAMSCVTASREIADDRSATIRSVTPVAPIVSTAPLPHRRGDVLTAAELRSAPIVPSSSAYDAVLRLRPSFLYSRDARMSATSARDATPAVFVNGNHVGGVEALRQISASTVAEMQYVRAMEALHQYGSSYSAGVILVRLAREGALRRD
jgi:hypothetical protein